MITGYHNILACDRSRGRVVIVVDPGDGDGGSRARDGRGHRPRGRRGRGRSGRVQRPRRVQAQARRGRRLTGGGGARSRRGEGGVLGRHLDASVGALVSEFMRFKLLAKTDVSNLAGPRWPSKSGRCLQHQQHLTPLYYLNIIWHIINEVFWPDK